MTLHTHILCQENIFERLAVSENILRGRKLHLAPCTQGNPVFFPKMFPNFKKTKVMLSHYLHNFTLTCIF